MKYLDKIQSFFLDRYRSLDRGLLYGGFILILYGILLTFAASPGVAARTDRETFYFIYRQLLFLLPGIMVLFATSFLSFKQIRIVSLLVLVGAMGLMVLIALFGSEIQGSKRWIYMGGLGLQPSEFAKPAFAVICAWLLASGRLIQHFRGYLYSTLLVGMLVILLLNQPDVGMAITVIGIFAVQLFLSGVSMMILTGLAGLLASGAVVIYFSFNHVYERINRFLKLGDSEQSYQVSKSLETLQNAGWFGKGPGEGLVKYELPDAHTDFIMAVSAEELGFILTAFLVCVFAFIVLRGFWLMKQENNHFCQIAIAGLLTQIAIQAIINMGSTLDMLPTKGMTLPFISYGGSSFVSMAFGFGIILGLTRCHTLSRGL